MKISKIVPSGSDNVLRWAINNNANVKTDIPLQSIINDELFYLVTFSDVNFFEVFRLTQMYREKVRITNKYNISIPNQDEMLEMFDGKININPDNPDELVMVSDIAAHVINNFINLVHQMEADDDIIHRHTVELFLPMIVRKYDIQIPVSFIDMIQSLSQDECSNIFNSTYPDSLTSLVEDDNNGFIHTLMLGFVKSTEIIRYNERYDKYLNAVKFKPLKRCKDDRLYRIGLTSFHKYDNAFKGECRCTLFNLNKDSVNDIYKRICMLKTPLEVDFAVQLPIQYMQILENSFERGVLTISCESSMNNIIDISINDGEFTFNDFVTPKLDPESDSVIEYNNSVSAYKLRITEANSDLLRSIPLILSDGTVSDVTSTFALLPAIYSTRAIITINTKYKDQYLAINDLILHEMFEEMFNIVDGVNYDISKYK